MYKEKKKIETKQEKKEEGRKGGKQGGREGGGKERKYTKIIIELFWVG